MCGWCVGPWGWGMGWGFSWFFGPLFLLGLVALIFYLLGRESGKAAVKGR